LITAKSVEALNNTFQALLHPIIATPLHHISLVTSILIFCQTAAAKLKFVKLFRLNVKIKSIDTKAVTLVRRPFKNEVLG
jgi:hypothetical protein